MTPAPAPVVEMTGITVVFPGVLALDDVDLRLFPGEVHAIMGENGAGKSTLVKALTGAYQLDRGEIRIDGVVRRLTTPVESAAAGIAPVYQDSHLVPNLSVAENVMLGNETRRRFGINWTATRRRAADMLGQLGLDDLDPRVRLSVLPPAIQQLVAIARAMVGAPRVLVLDEPTSSLEPDEVDRLFAVVC